MERSEMDTKGLIQAAAGIILSNIFTRLITLGYFTPEQASVLTKWLMDGFATIVPLIPVAWAAYKAKSSSKIKSTVALPDVASITKTDGTVITAPEQVK